MDATALPANPRRHFTFSTANLRPRDEMVFKTLLRLLQPQLVHHWEYAAQGGLLLLWGDATLQDLAQGQAAAPPEHAGVTLLLGANPQHQPHYLTLPLLPGRVQEHLNAMGRLLENSGLLPSQVVTKSAPLVSPQVAPLADLHVLQPLTQHQPQPPAAEKKLIDWRDPTLRFKLKRWPPHDCVAQASHIKMATSMLAVPTALAQLCQRGQVDEASCLQFCANSIRIKCSA